MSELAVVVPMPGADPQEHFVYLPPHSEWRDGPETMSDYLNSTRRFFPMVLGGVARMINREQIMWVRYEKLPDIIDGDVTLIEKLTILELTDGTRIEGNIPIDRPTEQSPASDLLNDPRAAFVRLAE